MKKDIYRVLGVMSGTSLDGIDLCYVEFKMNKVWSFEILSSKTVNYNSYWRSTLAQAIHLDRKAVDSLNIEYTDYLGNVIADFIASERIVDIDAVCSHGHTIFHEPDKGITVQIGNLNKLASIVNTKVVCDFRVQDVQLGGQGAPLVPIGDKLLFHEYDFCVNLGGFANVSYNSNGQRIAYDICPVNIVLNHYVGFHGKAYDKDGAIAKKGEINPTLLKKLNDLQFYELKPPKSLGLEWVKTTIFPIIDSYNLEVQDILRTFVEHCAIQISNEINKGKLTTALFTGGGVFNSFLMDCISGYSNIKTVVPPKEIVEYKEALIFGFLGVLKLNNEVNCLSSVTGAKRDHSSGNIFLP